MIPQRRRYQIVRTLGKGAFGTVYQALMTSEGGFVKDVAIKLMKDDIQSDIAEGMAQRQRDEARLLGLVRHRAILHVDGLVQLNGTWAVIMEFVDGADLKDILRGGRFPPAMAALILAEVAGALRAAYEAKAPDGAPLELIHRDIKPANIALTAAGGVKLLDFGIATARFEHREAETRGMLLGTLVYMAPERFDAIDGPAGDVYSLGVVLVELLTKKRMVKTSGNEQRHQRTVKEAIERVRRVLPEAEYTALIRLLTRMLDYDPERRPTAKECERALRECGQALPNPDVPAWAEQVIAAVKASRPVTVDDMSGATLVERSESTVTAPPTSSMRRWMIPAALLSTAGATLLLLGLAGVGLLGFYDVDDGSKAVNLADTPAPITEPLPAAQPESEPEPEPESDESLALIEAVLEVPIPEPRDIAPTPTPMPKAPPMGMVTLQGEGAELRFTTNGQHHSPGPVPTGQYLVTARFSGGEWIEVGQAQVVANGVVNVLCNATFQNCNID